MILHVPFSYPVALRIGKSRRAGEALMAARLPVRLEEAEAPVAAIWHATNEWHGRYPGYDLTLRSGPFGLLAACADEEAHPGGQRQGHAGLGTPADWSARVEAGEIAPWNPFRDLLAPGALPAPPQGAAILSGTPDAAAGTVKARASGVTLVDGVPHRAFREPYIVVGPAYEAGRPGWVSARPFDPASFGWPERCFRLSDWDSVRAAEAEACRAYGRAPVLPVENPVATIVDPAAFRIPFEAWAVESAALALLSKLAETIRDAAGRGPGPRRPERAWRDPDSLALPPAAVGRATAALASLVGGGLSDAAAQGLRDVVQDLAAGLPEKRAGVRDCPVREMVSALSRALDRHDARPAWLRRDEDGPSLSGLAP